MQDQKLVRQKRNHLFGKTVRIYDEKNVQTPWTIAEVGCQERPIIGIDVSSEHQLVLILAAPIRLEKKETARIAVTKIVMDESASGFAVIDDTAVPVEYMIVDES